MAQRTTIHLIDDLDGGAATQQVPFELDGTEYTIDLNDTNADRLRKVLAPYVAAARRTGGKTRGKTHVQVDTLHTQLAAAGLPQVSPGQVRAWAHEHGHEVTERGRIPHVVVAAYIEAHTTPAPAPRRRRAPVRKTPAPVEKAKTRQKATARGAARRRGARA